MPSGGQRLVYEILREQCASAPVTLLAFCNEQERDYFDPEDFRMCQKVKVFALSRRGRLFAALQYPGLPLTTSARYAAARRWLIGKTFDSVWIEFIQASSLLSVLPVNTPSTLVVHDLCHQALGRRAQGYHGWHRCFYEWEAKRTRRWEASVLQRPQRLLTLNEKDRDLIRDCSGRTDVEVRYPRVDECYRRVVRSPATIRPETILFWGLMSRAENEDAVTWFRNEVLPLIWQRRPAVKFIIAGANPGPAVRALAGPRVEVLGFVEDPLPLFSEMAMAVAPLRQGSGIKIKVVEYLAAGIPTVASPIGAEGIRPSPLLAVQTVAAEFAAACLVSLSKA